MEYNSLFDLITYLQYGTKLHIGVLFFGNYGNKKCVLPQEQRIHASRICTEFKACIGGLERCFRCRNAAIKKAHRTKAAFDGLCINGVYEYTRPVVIGKDVACIICIGNILEKTKGYEKLKKNLDDKDYLLDSLEKNFTYGQCFRLFRRCKEKLKKEFDCPVIVIQGSTGNVVPKIERLATIDGVSLKMYSEELVLRSHVPTVEEAGRIEVQYFSIGDFIIADAPN